MIWFHGFRNIRKSIYQGSRKGHIQLHTVGMGAMWIREGGYLYRGCLVTYIRTAQYTYNDIRQLRNQLHDMMWPLHCAIIIGRWRLSMTHITQLKIWSCGRNMLTLRRLHVRLYQEDWLCRIRRTSAAFHRCLCAPCTAHVQRMMMHNHWSPSMLPCIGLMPVRPAFPFVPGVATASQIRLVLCEWKKLSQTKQNT